MHSFPWIRSLCSVCSSLSRPFLLPFILLSSPCRFARESSSSHSPATAAFNLSWIFSKSLIRFTNVLLICFWYSSSSLISCTFSLYCDMSSFNLFCSLSFCLAAASADLILSFKSFISFVAANLPTSNSSFSSNHFPSLTLLSSNLSFFSSNYKLLSSNFFFR